MSVLERPEITSFIANWQNKPPEQAVEELASYSLETKRVPDPYYFLITTSGELFSPSSQRLVKDEVYTGNRLGQLEYQALCEIEHWAAQSHDGAAVWVSPPSPGVYPVSKIIISEIAENNGRRALFNRAIVFDYDEKECLKFAQDLAKYSKDKPLLLHLDQVRATPLFFNTQGNSWIYILQELVDDPKLWESIRNGSDQRAKKEALRQARMVQKRLFAASVSIPSYPSHEDQMAVMQMLGQSSGSCPEVFSTGVGKTAFQAFSENSLTFTGSTSKDPDFCKNCPVCGKQINCVVKMGGSCPECGAVKRCG